MMHRSDRVWLEPGEARCSPSSCSAKLGCARYMAHIPQGSPVTDFSATALGSIGCMSYRQMTKPPKIEKERTVKPFPGGGE